MKKICLNCKKEFDADRSYRKFCSHGCFRTYRDEKYYIEYIAKWKLGKISGLETTGVVSRQIKKFLREKFGNKCCLCGWSKVNAYTKKVPLVADHIDGNYRHNTEENLRLICPNCDSLQKTYAGANRGNGRKHRK